MIKMQHHQNAQAFLKVQQEFGSFDNLYLAIHGRKAQTKTPGT